MSGHDGALAAVDTIIDNFAHHRRDAYFAGFAPDATFLFHTTADRLADRAAYEALWREWEETADFRVHGCRSTNRLLQVFGDLGVFSHDVETTLDINGARETLHERESIIMHRRDGDWLCVHEHLSARPQPVKEP